MAVKYAVLEAADEDSLCPIMIAEGPFESYVIQIDTVSINDEGVLSFNYTVIEGSEDCDKQLFETTIGDIIVSMIMEKVNDNRSEHTEPSDQ